jgi:hypothetical protein
MRRGAKPKWVMQTVECALLAYREQKALLTREDVKDCLREKYGLRSKDVMDTNVDEARRRGYLYDLGSDEDVKRLVELGYRDLTRMHGRGKLVPTVLALIHLKIYRSIDEILRKMGIENEDKDENVKLSVRVFLNKISDVMNNILDAMQDGLREYWLGEIRRSGMVSVHRNMEEGVIVIKVALEGGHGFECRGGEENWEKVLDCIDKKWGNAPKNLKEGLLPPEKIRSVMFVIKAFKDSINGTPHPIPPLSIDYYEVFTNALLDLSKYYLRQELELKKKIRNEIKELVKRKLSEGGQA